MKHDEKTEIVMIPTDQLHPHPDNPRKDVGDVTELAESIKVNGVLQNLTVVPNKTVGEITGYTWQHGYKVIIGHRRLAAARLAGLEELPCVIVDMSEREQISTMLTENMQRSDLTVYEQAQGFQMMLDMGDSVEEIAEKSGFSTSTVRRRVKLLELDKEKFKASEARGVSLYEYEELDKLKSPERKNEVLEYIGTENFNFKLQQAISAEAEEERVAAWTQYLSAFATQVESYSGYKTVAFSCTSKKQDIERPEDADTVDYYFYIAPYGYIALLTNADSPSPEPEAEADARERRRLQEQKDADTKVLCDETDLAYSLRVDFVYSVSNSTAKEHFADIVALWVYSEYNGDIERWMDEDDILHTLDLTAPDEDDEDDGNDGYSKQDIDAAVSAAPAKAFLRLVYERQGDSGKNGYYFAPYNEYTVHYRKNKSLDNIYDLLEKLGYEMSDDEKALRYGTHELFHREVAAE